MSHPDVDYDLSFADIVAAINGLNADILEDANTDGCPLSGRDPNRETGPRGR